MTVFMGFYEPSDDLSMVSVALHGPNVPEYVVAPWKSKPPWRHPNTHRCGSTCGGTLLHKDTPFHGSALSVLVSLVFEVSVPFPSVSTDFSSIHCYLFYWSPWPPSMVSTAHLWTPLQKHIWRNTSSVEAQNEAHSSTGFLVSASPSWCSQVSEPTLWVSMTPSAVRFRSPLVVPVVSGGLYNSIYVSETSFSV